MEFVRLCWRDLWRNRRRSALTGLVMGFAVAAMIVFIGVSDGSHRQMIESATDTLLGHAQIQHAGYRDEPDLEHRVSAAELARLAPLLEEAGPVRAWTPRLLTGGLVSRKAPAPWGDDDEPPASATAEGAVVLGVQPDRERLVSQLATTVLPDVPASRCLRGCRAVLDGRGTFNPQRCEAACRAAAAGFDGAACAAVGRELCVKPCGYDALTPSDGGGEPCPAEACLATFADYCEPARFLAAATPAPEQPWLGEAVLGSGLARQLAVDVGDRVALTTGTATGRSFASLYRVVGVIHGGSSDVNRSALVTHLDKLSAGLDVPGAASAVVLAVRHASEAPEVAADLDLRVVLATPGLRAWSWRELSPELYLLLLLDSASLFVTLFLVIMVVGVILMNVVTMSVMERTREYGVRLALGESPRRIMWGLVAETLLLALVAGAAGCVLGEAGTLVLHVHGIDLGVDQIEVAGVLGNAVIYGDFSWSGLAFSLGTVVGFSVLGSLYPAWRIHRLQPVVALRFV